MSHTFDRRALRTVHLVTLTAYDAAGRVNADAQAEHTAAMHAAGMRVFLPAAGTSEFHSLSPDEIVTVVKATCAGTGPQSLVFAPVGLQIGQAIDVGVRSVEAGAAGVMVMPFSHPYLSDAAARDYYRALIDAVDCPVLIYRKGPIPSDALLLELADDPRVVGIKYAVNNLDEFRLAVLKGADRTEWLCGSAERFAPFYMLAGSGGYTTGAGNVCPHLTLAMHAALAAGEYTEGLRLQEKILPIENFRARSGDSYNISMLKHALHLAGRDFGPARPPQRQLTAAERTEIETLMQPIFAAEDELKREFASLGLTGERVVVR